MAGLEPVSTRIEASIRKVAWSKIRDAALGPRMMSFKVRPTRSKIFGSQPVERKLPIIARQSAFRKSWDTLIMLILLYYMIVVPFRIAFDLDSTGAELVIDIIIDFVFIGDVVINFRTGYYDNLENAEVFDAKKIALHYLKGWFVLDFLAAMPYFIFSASLGLQDPTLWRIPKLCRLIRLLKLARILGTSDNFLRKLEDLLQINVMVIRVAKLWFWILMMAHILACVLIFTARTEGFPEESWISSFSQRDGSSRHIYTVAIYWMVVTMSSTGYGDIAPGTDAERIIIMVCILVGSGAFAFTVGIMTSMVATMDRSSATYQKEMDEIRQYMRFRRVPADMQRRIFKYYEHLLSRNCLFDENQILMKLSDSLRSELSLYINREIIEKTPFFQNKDPNFVAAVVTCLKPIIVAPGDYLFRIGETADRMYIIHRGSVDLILPNGNVFKTLHEGMYFGEISLLTGHRRPMSARAVKYCDIFALGKDDLDRCLIEYPDAGSQLNREAYSRSRELEPSAKPLVRQLLVRTNNPAEDMTPSTGSSSFPNTPLAFPSWYFTPPPCSSPPTISPTASRARFSVGSTDTHTTSREGSPTPSIHHPSGGLPRKSVLRNSSSRSTNPGSARSNPDPGAALVRSLSATHAPNSAQGEGKVDQEPTPASVSSSTTSWSPLRRLTHRGVSLPWKVLTSPKSSVTATPTSTNPKALVSPKAFVVAPPTTTTNGKTAPFPLRQFLSFGTNHPAAAVSRSGSESESEPEPARAANRKSVVHLVLHKAERTWKRDRRVFPGHAPTADCDDPHVAQSEAGSEAVGTVTWGPEVWKRDVAAVGQATSAEDNGRSRGPESDHRRVHVSDERLRIPMLGPAVDDRDSLRVHMTLLGQSQSRESSFRRGPAVFANAKPGSNGGSDVTEFVRSVSFQGTRDEDQRPGHVTSFQGTRDEDQRPGHVTSFQGTRDEDQRPGHVTIDPRVSPKLASDSVGRGDPSRGHVAPPLRKTATFATPASGSESESEPSRPDVGAVASHPLRPLESEPLRDQEGAATGSRHVSMLRGELDREEDASQVADQRPGQDNSDRPRPLATVGSDSPRLPSSHVTFDPRAVPGSRTCEGQSSETPRVCPAVPPDWQAQLLQYILESGLTLTVSNAGLFIDQGTSAGIPASNSGRFIDQRTSAGIPADVSSAPAPQRAPEKVTHRPPEEPLPDTDEQAPDEQENLFLAEQPIQNTCDQDIRSLLLDELVDQYPSFVFSEPSSGSSHYRALGGGSEDPGRAPDLILDRQGDVTSDKPRDRALNVRRHTDGGSGLFSPAAYRHQGTPFAISDDSRTLPSVYRLANDGMPSPSGANRHGTRFSVPNLPLVLPNWGARTDPPPPRLDAIKEDTVLSPQSVASSASMDALFGWSST